MANCFSPKEDFQVRPLVPPPVVLKNEQQIILVLHHILKTKFMKIVELAKYGKF